MIKFPRGLGQSALFFTCGALALTVSASGQNYPSQPYPAQNYQNYPPYQGQGAPAYQPPPPPAPTYRARDGREIASPTCIKLETQLDVLNQSKADTTMQSQIAQAEQAVAQQQSNLDRLVAQARRDGCGGGGFFSLFSGFSPKCGPLNSKIDQLRGDLDTAMSNVEQLKSGGNDQNAQRAALIDELAQNNCGSQYTEAARAAGRQGFFEALLGNGTVISPNGNGAPAGTYRTVCVRTCDGYYFPISYSTVPSRFSTDAASCQRLCPAAQVELFTYHNPGESIEQAVSLNGASYASLPNAFRYRKEIVAGCSCRKPGESWADALRNADDASTLQSGDIIVNGGGDKATPVPASTVPASTPSAAAAPAASGTSDAGVVDADAKNRKVRIVGPPFLPQH